MNQDTDRDTNGTRFSPVHLHLLLHYYARSDAPMNLYANLETTGDYTKHLLVSDLIEVSKRDVSKYNATPKGVAYISMILNTPLPIQNWIDPRTGKQIL